MRNLSIDPEEAKELLDTHAAHLNHSASGTVKRLVYLIKGIAQSPPSAATSNDLSDLLLSSNREQGQRVGV